VISESENEVTRFGDLPSERAFPYGVFYPLAEVLGSDIIVKDFVIAGGEYGNYAIINFESDGFGDNCVTTTGGTVIMRKLNQARDKGLLPLLGNINHNQRYYDIV